MLFLIGTWSEVKLLPKGRVIAGAANILRANVGRDRAWLELQVKLVDWLKLTLWKRGDRCLGTSVDAIGRCA